MRKRKYALSAMLVTLALVLAACDQSASPSDSQSEEPTASESASATEAPTGFAACGDQDAGGIDWL